MSSRFIKEIVEKELNKMFCKAFQLSEHDSKKVIKEKLYKFCSLSIKMMEKCENISIQPRTISLKESWNEANIMTC